MKAYPTKYAGTQFRSRLEARWAAFFDVMGWTWEYEPFDLKKYIPDFLIDTTLIQRLLVEVKPVTKLFDYEPAQRKIQRSGWKGEAVTVGAMIGTSDEWTGDREACLGTIRDADVWIPWLVSPRADIVAAWREAGNRVQWRGVARVTEQPKPRNPGDDIKLTASEVRSFFGELAEELD